MSQTIQQAIRALQSEQQRHLDSAAKLGSAIQQLRAVANGTDEPAAKTKRQKRKRGKVAQPTNTKKAATPRKPAKRAGKRSGKITLSSALFHVLGQYRQAKKEPVGAKQLYDDVQKAGFKFGGGNVANNMNYLYKTLRRSKEIKREGEGYAPA